MGHSLFLYFTSRIRMRNLRVFIGRREADKDVKEPANDLSGGPGLGAGTIADGQSP